MRKQRGVHLMLHAKAYRQLLLLLLLLRCERQRFLGASAESREKSGDCVNSP